MLGVLAVVCTPGTASSQSAPPRPWVFVGDANYPPLSYVEDGVQKGFDVALIRELSRVLGREIRFEQIPYDDAQRRVLAGEADAITDMGISPERREQFDFALATVTHEFGLFVRRDDQSIRSLADLSGKRVGVTLSPFAGTFLARQIDAQHVTVSGFEEGFRQLVNREVDVLAFDSWVASPMIRGFERHVRLVGVPFATTATAIAVRKGNAEVLAEINRGLTILKANGTVHRLTDEWRPKEMLFLRETQVETVAQWIAGAAFLVGLGAMSMWIVSLRREVRHRRDVETALAASEAKFAKAFAASPDMMVIIDVETRRILEVNNQMVSATGFSREELVGRTSAELALVANRSETEPAREALLRDGSIRDVEYTMRRRDGSLYTVLASAECIEIAGRQVALWVHRDVTESRRLESRLRESQKMDVVGRLAAGVAHDFNNLLTLINGYSQLALPHLPPSSPIRRMLVEMQKTCERASALTGQLLAFSRRQIIQPRVVDLNEAVTEAHPLLSRLIGEDVRLATDLDPQAGCIDIDPGQLQQVFMNLAANARDAMPGGGELVFRTVRDVPATGGPARVRLDVIDTGIGISSETRAHMFEPFFTTKEIGQGTGLGLATVHEIVTTSGGTIDVFSEPDRGACFTMIWPCSTGATLAPAPEPVPQAATSTLKARILLAEDESELRELLSDYLAGLGHQVTAARSGEEALSVAGHTTPPDLLITDVVMAGMNGRTLADAIRARFPGTRVLYLSGYTDDAILRRGVMASEVNFLQKPFALSTFAEVVSHALQEDATTVPLPPR